MLLGNILLAVAWAALQGQFSLANLLIGYALGYVVLAALARGGVLPSDYRTRVQGVLSLAGFLLKEFLFANFKMAIDVTRPIEAMNPGIVRVPLDANTDSEILMLSTLINLTPGTISLDISSDKKYLFLHVMHVDSVEAIRSEIKDGFERRVLEVLRGTKVGG